MRNWGMVITSFYALIVVGLLVPAMALLADESPDLKDLAESYTHWALWLWVGMLVGGEALLLFLSVDTSRKRLKPRQHILVSISTAAVLFALLTFAALISLEVAVFGSRIPESLQVFRVPDSTAKIFAWWAGLWLFWAILFYLYLRDSPRLITRLVSWLLAGSVLELLIAIPCHLIVRQRNECTEPAVTSFGVVTGIAIMLLSFGPSVLLLYRKRLNAYAKPHR